MTMVMSPRRSGSSGSVLAGLLGALGLSGRTRAGDARSTVAEHAQQAADLSERIDLILSTLGATGAQVYRAARPERARMEWPRIEQWMFAHKLWVEVFDTPRAADERVFRLTPWGEHTALDRACLLWCGLHANQPAGGRRIAAPEPVAHELTRRGWAETSEPRCVFGAPGVWMSEFRQDLVLTAEGLRIGRDQAGVAELYEGAGVYGAKAVRTDWRIA